MTADADLIARIEAEDDERMRRLAAQVEAPASRGAVETALRPVGLFGAGANDRIAEVAGAPFDLVNRGLRAVGVPIPEGSVVERFRRGIRAVTGEPPVPETTGERLIHGAGGGLVDAATTLLPATAVARGAQAGSLTAGTAGALAAQPVAQGVAGMVGGGVSEATGNPLLGMAASVATPVAAAAGGRLLTPIRTPQAPGQAALVAAAEREGIPLSPGEITGNRFLRNVEAQFEQLPFTSARAAADRQAQSSAFNRAVLSRAGVDEDIASPEVLNQARARIGGQFNELTSRNSLRVDDALLDNLARVEEQVTRYSLPEIRNPVMNRINDLLAQADDGGRVPGVYYRQLDSALGRDIRSTSNGDLRNALDELRQALRASMDTSISPEDSAAWNQARREYANLMVAARAVGGAGAGPAAGNISPLALRGAVDRSTGGGYAFGRGDLNELARIGQSVLRPPPDSGTAGRNYANQLLTGSIMSTGAGAGALAGGLPGALAGSAMALGLPPALHGLYRTAPVRGYLTNRLLTGPSSLSATPNVLMQQAVGQATQVQP